jgi:hypothetical protein
MRRGIGFVDMGSKGRAFFSSGYSIFLQGSFIPNNEKQAPVPALRLGTS